MIEAEPTSTKSLQQVHTEKNLDKNATAKYHVRRLMDDRLKKYAFSGTLKSNKHLRKIKIDKKPIVIRDNM